MGVIELCLVSELVDNLFLFPDLVVDDGVGFAIRFDRVNQPILTPELNVTVRFVKLCGGIGLVMEGPTARSISGGCRVCFLGDAPELQQSLSTPMSEPNQAESYVGYREGLDPLSMPVNASRS